MATPKTRGRPAERREPIFDVTPQDEPEDDIESAPPPRVSPSRRPKKAKRKSGKRDGKRDGNRRRGIFGRALYWGAVAGLWLVIAAIGGTVWVGAHLPPIQSLEVPKRPPAIKIVDRQGHLLATRGDMGGSAVRLRDLPRYVPQAFVAIEDRRFYSHHGIDPFGIARAAIANLLHRGVSQGGSTITQQLAKNLFLTQERTFTRKIQEAALSLWLERKFSKTQILDMYLNRVYFGSGAYGIEAAAQRYFAKPAQQLTVAEAAMLAGLVRSPSRLAPSRNPNGAEKRAQLVLAAMSEMKFITDGMAKTALMEPARVYKPAGAGSVGYVADWIMDVLDDLVGRVDQDIVVETSIDPVLQASAETALVDELAKNGAKAGVGQGAVVAMSPDGAVRALVGGKNYAESQFNRAVAAKRQPGSAFKPFVYLTAIEHGLTPDTVREDKPIAIKGWRPENYSHQYFGAVPLHQALAMSLNTVSVRLTLEFTPAAVVRTAHRLGIASKLEPNASIALGTSEVSVIELVGAYATFANGGFAVAPHVVERVRTAGGKLVYQRAPDNLGRVVDLRAVGMMNAMMRETLTTGTAHKAELPGWPAAGKTGTSQDFRDAWFVGYTGHLVTGVWLGNDDNSPTRKTTGGGLPVEIWSRVMKAAHQGVPVVALPGTSATSAPVTANPFPSFGLPFGPPSTPQAGIPRPQADMPRPSAGMPQAGLLRSDRPRTDIPQAGMYQAGVPRPPIGVPQAGVPRPPVGVPQEAAAQPARGDDSIDGWLANRLFGRR
ncbi:MAG TPA: PBP1A family penicillin-binding protein [Xanthobacteraceae bacterium]|jgi:penicillin-binding protein 1A|nr:PBP1A family penicillin-binding protein [Xanthobacteraceae bacterium]